MPVHKATTASSPAPIAPSICKGPTAMVSTPPVGVLLEEVVVGFAVTVTVPGPVVCDFNAVTSIAEYTISLAGMALEVLRILPPPCATWEHVTGEPVKKQSISTVL